MDLYKMIAKEIAICRESLRCIELEIAAHRAGGGPDHMHTLFYEEVGTAGGSGFQHPKGGNIVLYGPQKPIGERLQQMLRLLTEKFDVVPVNPIPETTSED